MVHPVQTAALGQRRLLSFGLALASVCLVACADAECPSGTSEVNGRCLETDTSTDGEAAGGDAGPLGVAMSPNSAAPVSDRDGAAGAGNNAANAGQASSGGMSGGAGAPETTPPGAAGNASQPSNSGMSSTGCVPKEEDCNGIDDDCDKLVDEQLTRPCGSDVGLCQPGVLSCHGGAWDDESACSGGRRAEPEVCDPEMVDEDCNGSSNEGCSCAEGQTQPCGESSMLPCVRGTKTCANGKWPTECSGAVNPTREACDGVDNDCNGRTDDGSAICPAGRFCGGADGCVACRTGADCGDPGTCKVKFCDPTTHTCVPKNADASVECDRGHCDRGQCVECSNASECEDRLCQTKTCSSGMCRYSAVAAGQRQSCPSGQVCSSAAACVDCVSNSDCGAAEVCTPSNTCQRKPAVCGDGTAERDQGELCDPGKGEGVGTMTCSAQCKTRNLYGSCSGSCADSGSNCYAGMCVPSSCPTDLPGLQLYDDAGYCMVICSTASDCPSPFSQCATIGGGRLGCFL